MIEDQSLLWCSASGSVSETWWANRGEFAEDSMTAWKDWGRLAVFGAILGLNWLRPACLDSWERSFLSENNVLRRIQLVRRFIHEQNSWKTSLPINRAVGLFASAASYSVNRADKDVTSYYTRSDKARLVLV